MRRLILEVEETRPACHLQVEKRKARLGPRDALKSAFNLNDPARLIEGQAEILNDPNILWNSSPLRQQKHLPTDHLVDNLNLVFLRALPPSHPAVGGIRPRDESRKTLE